MTILSSQDVPIVDMHNGQMCDVELEPKEFDNGNCIVHIGRDGPSKQRELINVVQLFTGGLGTNLGVTTNSRHNGSRNRDCRDKKREGE